MNGIIAVNKPSGISSSDVVVKCRIALSKALGYKVKCGHMGTLDPLACGVLVLGVGKAARLFDVMQIKKKSYRARILFGVETDTLDSEGEVIAKSSLPKYADVVKTLDNFRGDILQVPPAYSAISINGKRAYALAREGVQVEIEPRKVRIFDLKVVREECEGELCKSIDIDIECSSGTYIRSLVRDIAHSLGVVGYMAYLIRSKSGNFDINNAVTLDEFLANPVQNVIDTLEVLKDILPIYEVPEELKKKVVNGVGCKIGDNIQDLCVLTIDGKVFSIAQTKNDITKSITNLWEDEK